VTSHVTPRQLNEAVVKLAVARDVATPRIAAADTTVQEAAIPYANEMGLMATFLETLATAARRSGKAL
jgi:hypothetical protein